MASKPKPNSIVDAPATVAACRTDRANAKGPAPARDQLALARTAGNTQAATPRGRR